MQYDLKKLMENTDQGKENSYVYYGEYHSEYIRNCVSTLKNAGCDDEELLIAMAYHDFCLYVYNFRAARDTGMMCKLNDKQVSILTLILYTALLTSELLNVEDIENITYKPTRWRLLVIMLVATMCRIKGLPHGEHNYKYYASLVESDLQIEASCSTHLLSEAVAKLKELENE